MLHTLTLTLSHTHTHIHIHTHRHTHIYIYIHSLWHTYSHTHTYAHLIQNNHTALINASSNGETEIAKILIEKGADTDIKGRVSTYIHNHVPDKFYRWNYIILFVQFLWNGRLWKNWFLVIWFFSMNFVTWVLFYSLFILFILFYFLFILYSYFIFIFIEYYVSFYL